MSDCDKMSEINTGKIVIESHGKMSIVKLLAVYHDVDKLAVGKDPVLHIDYYKDYINAETRKKVKAYVKENPSKINKLVADNKWVDKRCGKKVLPNDKKRKNVRLGSAQAKVQNEKEEKEKKEKKEKEEKEKEEQEKKGGNPYLSISVVKS